MLKYIYLNPSIFCTRVTTSEQKLIMPSSIQNSVFLFDIITFLYIFLHPRSFLYHLSQYHVVTPPGPILSFIPLRLSRLLR